MLYGNSMMPKCVCNAFESFKKYNHLLKLMQFLMGLDDSYMQIRSSILSIEVLPDVRSAYATISSEESHRVSAGSIVGSSQRNQASTFVSYVPNRNNFQRNTQNLNNGPRPNNMNNNRQGGDSGSPISILKGKNASSNNYVEFSLSSGFTDEQMTTLLFLIKDNKIGKNVQPNMAGFESGKCSGDWLGHHADHVLNVLKKSLQIDNNEENLCCEVCQRAKQTREHFPLSDHVSSSLGDLVHLDLWGPYKVTTSEGFRYFFTVVDDYTRAVWDYDNVKNDNANVFQDVNHLDFFDHEYPEIPNDDERVDPKLNNDNKSQSASSSSSESGRNSFTTDFSVNSENDADSSDNIFATQNEGVTTLEENIFSKGNMDQNPSSSSQDVQNLRRSSRQSVFPQNYNEFVVDSKVKYGIKKYVGTWEIVELPKGRKAMENDIIITGNNVSETKKFKVFLKSKFMIKDLGKLKYFLGIEVIDTDKGICLNQRKYILDLLFEYGMLACKPVNTPLISKLVISNEATEKDLVLDNITDYQKLMGKLIYLTNTRPDISYVVHCLSQFMHSPLTSYLKTTFKILRYLKGCPGLGIHFIKNYGMSLSTFSDVD
ncbi:ribonuclease H-like domain-containing protein [Tanacetum coccineum]